MLVTLSSMKAIIFTASQRSCRRVLFSVMSVHQPVILPGGGAVPCHHYPRCIRPHHTMGPYCPCPQSPQLWDLTVQRSSAPASEIWWPRLDTFSYLFTWRPSQLPGADSWWLMQKVQSANRRYAPYWNALLSFSFWQNILLALEGGTRFLE